MTRKHQFFDKLLMIWKIISRRISKCFNIQIFRINYHYYFL